MALANFGELAALSELLDHKESSVREAAADSLRFISPVDDAVVAVLASGSSVIGMAGSHGFTRVQIRCRAVPARNGGEYTIPFLAST